MKKLFVSLLLLSAFNASAHEKHQESKEDSIAMAQCY